MKITSPEHFLGIDWGTSRFRLMAVNASGEATLLKESNRGLSQLTQAEAAQYLQDELAQHHKSPVLMAGMVGSNIGLQETPYIDAPVTSSDLAANLVPVTLAPFVERQMYIVPGVRWRDPEPGSDKVDVMRGEEVQVMGWLRDNGAEPHARLCLPGTHAKWVTVANGAIGRISTALTGELYQLLCAQSLLVRGQQHHDEAEFINGVHYGAERDGLLHQLFSIRARVVAGNANASHSASFLSGLLIASEMVNGLSGAATPVHLVGADELTWRYALAAQQLGIDVHCWSGEALMARGLASLWNLYVGRL
jgi:2-dehydro-3-deoxygalactonokinase